MPLPLGKVPNTKIHDDPTIDSIWHRWFERLLDHLTLPDQGLGTVESVDITGGQLLTFTGGPITTSGSLTPQTGSILAFAAAHG